MCLANVTLSQETLLALSESKLFYFFKFGYIPHTFLCRLQHSIDLVRSDWPQVFIALSARLLMCYSSATVTSGPVTQCRALPRAPEHLKGLGVLTITQPASHVTVQVAASLDCVLLPNSTVTHRVTETAGGPANSCQEEACHPAQRSQTYPPSSTFNKLTFLLWTFTRFHNCALCGLTQSLLTFSAVSSH